jgi:hypothetical protein
MKKWKEGSPVGTLACYWQSVSGHLVILGIKVKGQEVVRVVPSHRSQLDDRHAYIGSALEDIEPAALVGKLPRLASTCMS